MLILNYIEPKLKAILLQYSADNDIFLSEWMSLHCINRKRVSLTNSEKNKERKRQVFSLWIYIRWTDPTTRTTIGNLLIILAI